MTFRALIPVVVVALATLLGCSARDGASDWVARAEAANQEADRRLSAGDVDGARGVLKAAVAAGVPGSAKPADARALRQDLYYRLASLELGKARPKDAADWATRGLELGRAKDVFTSNLLIVRGRALEQQGDPRGASRDYHDALLVTEALLDVSLQGGSP
jgi:hypothetical protein